MGQSKGSSARENTCRLQKMAYVKALVFFLLVSGALGARQLRGSVQGRDQRSLTNTFPFNQKAGGEEHHGDHGDHHGRHGEASELVSRTGRVSDAKADADADADAGANPNPYFGLYGYPYGGYYGIGYPYSYFGKR